VTGTSDAPSGAAASPRRPGGRALATVALLVAMQGALLVAVALFYLVALVIARPDNVAAAVGILVLAALGGIGLVLVARGLYVGRRWGRAPALVTQMIFIPVALGSFPQGWYVGAPLLVWAIAVTVLLFVPSVSEALED
jgi:hypothetical protein